MSEIIYTVLQASASVMIAYGVTMTGQGRKRVWLISVGITILHATIGK